MADYFSTPDDLGDIRQSDLQGSLGGRLGAEALNAIDPQNSLSAMYIGRRMREEDAGGADIGVPGAGGDVDVFSGQPLEQRQATSDAFRDAIPDTSIEDAKARVKQEGLDGLLKLPDQPSVKSPVLDLMISEAHERRDREVAIAKGPQGFIPGALGLVTSIGAGMIDPVNAAAFSIPVLGEARWGKLLASAGDSLAARAGVRTLEGAAQGAVGTAVLQPADWWLHTKDGQDYTFADALKSVVMGAGMGGAFHAGGGLIGDIAARREGQPLPGSPQDLLNRGLMTGRHIPAVQTSDEGLTADFTAEQLAAMGEGPVFAPPVGPLHPADVLADLPPAAQEDAVRSAISDVTQDQPVRAGDMLNIAADHDPRIAESFEAYHGSPFDFHRFDVGKIGEGEGAEAYGRGLYFAEEPQVAKDYQARLAGKSDDLVDQLAGQALGFDSDRAVASAKLRERAASEERDPFAGIDPKAMRAGADKIDAGWKPSEGHLYKVRIKANHEHFLDWDKPLSEQPQAVKDIVKQQGLKFYEAGSHRISATDESQLEERATEPTGSEIYQELQRRRAFEVGTPRDFKGDVAAHVSDMMGKAGIPGVKYLDQGSRTPEELKLDLEELNRERMRAEDAEYSNASDRQVNLDRIDSEIKSVSQKLKNPTRNFVVFDDKHIEITHKNGEKVALPERAAPPEPAPQRETTVTINGKTTRVEYPSHGERAAAAAEDPRWRELADVRRPEDDPYVVAESKQADRLAEPDSLVPERSLTALEKQAADAEEAWRKLEPTLSDEERATFNEAFDALKADKEARDQVINDGVACLVQAAA